MSLDDHAEELASDLGVDKAEVTQDLQNLVEYSVPIGEAKQSLRRKYGDSGGGSSGGPTAASIGDIDPDTGNVTVTATVLTAGQRSIRYQGDDHVIFEGELADETGRISYTAWEDFALHSGNNVTIGNASVREWEGNPELNFGESSTVEPSSESLDISYEVGGDRSLADLQPGDRGRNIDVQVTEVETRTINGRDGETEILSGVLGDESARLPFTDWNPHPELEPGVSVRLEDVYVRQFRGVPSVNISEFSTVRPLDTNVNVGGPTRLTERAAVNRGGAYDVELLGNVIEVRDGSGLIQRCPECGRVVQKGQCRQHGSVEAEDDMRIKAILDDGTDTVTAVLDRDLTEDVYGGGLEDARQQARDAMDQEVVADTIAETIVGHEYRVRGHLSVDEYGANLETTEFNAVEDNPEERARTLLAEVDA